MNTISNAHKHYNVQLEQQTESRVGLRTSLSLEETEYDAKVTARRVLVVHNRCAAHKRNTALELWQTNNILPSNARHRTLII